MAKAWTIEKVKERSVADRYRLYLRACEYAARGDAAGADLKALIETSGLEFRPGGGISHDDPHYTEMVAVIDSKAGEDAIRLAIAEGMPPMAKVDLLLQQKMGDRYDNANQKTLTAGFEVARRARELGYRTTGRKSGLPSGCIARTAEVMEPVNGA